jgi:MCM P-loop domain
LLFSLPLVGTGCKALGDNHLQPALQTVCRQLPPQMQALFSSEKRQSMLALTMVQALLIAMEQGEVSIAKAGMVATLPARTAVLAAANPKNGEPGDLARVPGFRQSAT